ncbi:hypothetical protein [Natrinema salifodinae]|uniref:Uncharacterized protein n=1 Tax=Natrinema salifodinae TaxID=1202768 RepID=A0A1I0MKW3_9EURY|nr:hypothetical protein [Natrinema salifodinae]SEV88705.1 hypothetical protein SAMN05216285_1075 [Natrinema salifodinae]
MTTETTLARLSHWFRQRPNSIEFWELVLTDERLLWCFVGESYRSLLLRADMGERDREAIADLPPAEVATYDDRNFAVPLDDLDELRLVTGTRLRRARLAVAWREGDDDVPESQPESESGSETATEERTLYQSRTADPQRELVADLAADPRLADVDVTVEAPRFPRL